MAIERGRLIEIVVSIAAVGGFVAVLIAIGLQFNREGLSADGGLALLAAITVFILIMAAVGYGLANMSLEE